MIIDAHIHCSGIESTPDVLQALDGAGVDLGVLLAPFLSGDYRLHDRESLQRGNAHLGRLVDSHGDRLFGLAVVNPGLPGATDDLRRAVDEDGLRGVKMVPSGWHPYDDCAHAVYTVADEYRLPILFHSGIFIDGRSGRYCRPTFFEALRDHPRLRVCLAHLGWPWCDEANAVGLIDLINGVPADDCQFRFDVSFGAPPIQREAVLRNALAILGPGLLQFGSDRFLPCDAAAFREARAELDRWLDLIDVSPADRARIYGGTAAAWLGLATNDDNGARAP